MNQFRFAQVEWLQALWLVLVVGIVLVVLELRGGRLLERLVSPMMQARLVRRLPLGRRITAVLLLCAALTAMVFALMRPQWGSSVQLQTRVDSQIMICLDVSRSMLAEDVVPNRLERAKAEIDSLLSLMQEGQQVGLMAFAGKASVLCPLTTDFGFLRLILNEANPGTVGLGGTRIGEAISKAVAGFRDVGDVNRLILLITDGEDHDSFPLDAAKEAKEKGVRIVSIGFGDELGSKIEVTDPHTGARSYIEDRDGAAVISRLDGETLRQIALETEGAYIPAGTGVLDWQSIYNAHIARFLQGTQTEEETVIRHEAYQWCVLLALVCLFAALATSTLSTSTSRPMTVNPKLIANANATSRTASWMGWGLIACWLWDGSAVLAQVNPPPTAPQVTSPAASTAPQTAADPLDSTLSSTAPDRNDQESTAEPRELYNQAVAYISSDVDRAERLLNAARRQARVDGELRYRALYNLGWVEVNRAEELLAEQPEQALKHLELAAGRFREAIHVREQSDEARHNLEIITRRILELSDSLAEKDSGEFAERLDQLIIRIRQHQSELQRVCSRIDAEGTQIEKYRNDFRQLGVVERQIISDVEKLATDARTQLASQQAATGKKSATVKQAATADQEAVETAQLSAMLGYLDSSLQRMHKARSFIRRLQAERAFVRWAAGLSDAKRARDQLRDPLEVLAVLITDASEQTSLIRLMHLTGKPPESAAPAIDKPSWLSDEVLSDEQQATIARTAELHALLSAGVAQARQSTANDQAPAPADGAEMGMEMGELLANIALALPFIAKAQEMFDQAQQSTAAHDWQTSLVDHSAGVQSLMEAAEVFYDIRRLIDATLADQHVISSSVERLSSASGESSVDNHLGDASHNQSPEIDQSTLLPQQQKNLQRVDRMAGMFVRELARIDQQATAQTDSSDSPQGNAQSGSGNASDADAESMAAERQRFDLAEQLRSEAELAMRVVVDALSDHASLANEVDAGAKAEAEERPPSPRRSNIANAHRSAIKANGEATAALEELQRLFFSVVEHLRQTARRQTELTDNTTQLLAQADQQTPERIGPVTSRQQALQETAVAIADALRQQATTMTDATESPAPSAADPVDDPTPTDKSQSNSSPDAAATLTQASELVRAGGEAMQSAVKQLSASPAPLAEAVTEQQLALEKLMAALELLDPPQSQDQNQDQSQPQQQPQDKSDEKTESNPQSMDAEQMLQAIREREANRRRERQPQQASSASGVEKDW